ncbi:MAG: hypothetical protein IKB34_04735 [Clostridia bacterium]|nr:hypothetical protein [Clostridia bacterium]
MTSFEICKSQWRKILVGTPDELAIGDKTVNERIASCGRKANLAWDAYKANGKKPDAVGLFRDTKSVTSGDMTREYARLSEMALGYATYGTDCYLNEELLSDILAALEWGYTHYYGEAELEYRGWRDMREFNWWDWCIGTPTGLMNTMILVDSHLTLEQKKNYLKVFNHRVPKPRDYGSNKVHFGYLIAQAGILCENAEQILVGRDGIEDTYLYADGGVNDGQGFYRDGSYIFHTLHPMNFTYGHGHFSGITDFAAILAGSEFQLKTEHTELLYTWLYNSFLPFSRNGEIFRSVLGRHPKGTRGSACGFLKTVIRLYGLSSDDKKSELSDVITMLVDEHPLSENGYCNEIFGSLTLNDYLLLRQAYNPKGAQVDRRGLYAFNCMDRAVQHADRYAFALSVSSSRIYNYECINHENMNGWYHGDGMLCLVSSPFKYGPEYWNGVDPYRIPGTTADDRPRELITIAQANEYLSSKDLVGTLTTGDTGVSVMQLESYHGDGELISKRFYNPSGSYGNAPAKRDCTLTANKAYFFMDGYAICLGSAINAHDNAKVYTVIENRHGDPIIEGGHVVGHCTLPVTFNGEGVELTDTDTVYEGVRYITMGSDAYCVIDGKAITAKRTDVAPGFSQIVIDHGINPQNQSYAYAILPNTGIDGAKSFSDNTPFEVLENSASVQAIREKSTGDLYCVFHQAAEIAGITASCPILCSLKGNSLYVCDVTQKLGKITLKVNGKEYGFDFTNAYGKAQCTAL